MALTEHLAVLLTGEGGQLINEFSKVGGAAKKAYADAGKGASEASTASSGFDKVASGVSTRLKGMGIDANVTGGMLKAGLAAGAGVAGGALVKFAADGVKSFLDMTSQARSVQRVTGATAEQASGLAYAFRRVGIDVDTAAPALARFGKKAEDNKDIFDKYSITIAKNKDGTTDLVGTFENAADAISKMTDPAERDAAAIELFGKQGAALLPILTQGKQGIEQLFGEAGKHHDLFSQSDLDNGKRLKIAITDLSEAFKGLQTVAVSGMAPALTNVAHGATTAVDGFSELTKSVGGLGGLFDDVVQAIPGLGELDILGHAASNNTDKLDKMEKKARENITTASELKERLYGEAEAADEAAKKHDEQAKAIDGVINASVAAVDSTLGLERATHGANDAVTDYTQKLNAASAAGGKNADANKALDDATLNAKESIVNEAGAAVKLAQDQAAAAGSTLSAKDAAKIFHDKLIELAGHIGGPLHDQLINLANTINYSVPDAKEIVISINASGIAGQVAYINSQLNGIVNPSRRFGGGGVSFQAEGGLISSATLAVVGEAGPELILPLSKPSRMAQLLAQANLIKPFSAPSFSGRGGGGLGGSATIVNVNVAGSVTTERDLVDAVRRGVLDTKRRNGSAGLS